MTTDPITRSTFSQLCGAEIDAETLQGGGGLVYVQTHHLHRNLDALAAAGTCVLVTHSSDSTATPAMLDALPDNVKHWFAVNCGIKSPKVTALPIGLKANYPADEPVKAMHAAERRQQGAAGLAYVCLGRRGLTPGQADEREGLYRMAWAWATYERDSLPDRFYAGVRGHAYTLCPRGAGHDTHRLWEALHLGSIPICRRCTVLEQFADLPILFVHAWEQLTEAMLNENLPRLRAMFPAAQEKLTAEYWRAKIKGAR